MLGNARKGDLEKRVLKGIEEELLVWKLPVRLQFGVL